MLYSGSPHWLLDLLLDGETLYDSDRRDRSALRKYQNWLVEKIKEVPYLYLAVDMGLGKTVSALTALLDLDEWPVLVVAPLLVAQETWPEEVEEWDHLRHLTYSVVCGTAAERRAALDKSAQLYFVNFENFQWMREHLGRRWPFKIMVVDEATRIKGAKKRTARAKGLRADGVTPRTGSRTSRFGAICRVRGLLDRVILLSGTPAPAGLHDLWGPMYVLDYGERLENSMTRFENRYFDVSPYTHEIKPEPWAEEQIMAKVSDVMFSLRSEDYLELPPLIENPIKLSMTASEEERYRKFERTLYDELFDVEAASQGVLTNKLLQFANGSLYLEDGIPEPIHDHKLKALESIVHEANGQPILVAYSYKFDVPRIMKKFPRARLLGDKPGWRQEWNKREIPILLCHPASAGHGLNLQKGAGIGVFYGLQWSLELHQQFIKRLWRSGQKENQVLIHYIMMRGTADEKIFPVLQERAATQDRITAAIKASL